MSLEVGDEYTEESVCFPITLDEATAKRLAALGRKELPDEVIVSAVLRQALINHVREMEEADE
jgi:hypothetical protein